MPPWRVPTNVLNTNAVASCFLVSWSGQFQQIKPQKAELDDDVNFREKDRVSLCHYVELSGLELTEIYQPHSQELGLKAWAATPREEK